MIRPPALPSTVAQVVTSWPQNAQDAFDRVRGLAYDAAPSEAGLDDGLRWREPSFLTRSGYGSTVRCAFKPAKPDAIGVYFICTTGLVDEFRARFSDQLDLFGNREIRLPLEGDWDEDTLSICLARALSYHKSAALA